MDAIAVSVPASPGFVAILRSVTASVSARMDFPYDAIDDLCLAVDEASSHLLQNAGEPEMLTLTIGLDDEGIEVVVASDGSPEEWPLPDYRQGFGWRVLGALIDEANFDRSEQGIELRLRKRIPPAALTTS
jgi:serine/threonine-protein kinase RsbW